MWRAAEAERDRSRQDALGLARRLAADVDRELDGVVLTLQALAASPALQTGDLATFAAQARAVPGFRGGEVILSDRAGRRLLSAGAPEARPPSWGRPPPRCSRPARPSSPACQPRSRAGASSCWSRCRSDATARSGSPSA